MKNKIALLFLVVSLSVAIDPVFAEDKISTVIGRKNTEPKALPKKLTDKSEAETKAENKTMLERYTGLVVWGLLCLKLAYSVACPKSRNKNY